MPSLMARIWNALAAGIVSAIDDTGTVMRLQIKVGPWEIHTLPAPQQFGFSSVPPLESDVAAHYVAGDRSNGVITATNHQPTRPTGKNPGESQMHDAFGKYIYLTEDGGIVINANGSDVTVNGAETLTMNAAEKIVANTPSFQCTGDIIDNTGTNEQTMAGMRTTYNGHNHDQKADSAGDAEQPTDVPNQLME